MVKIVRFYHTENNSSFCRIYCSRKEDIFFLGDWSLFWTTSIVFLNLSFRRRRRKKKFTKIRVSFFYIEFLFVRFILLCSIFIKNLCSSSHWCIIDSFFVLPILTRDNRSIIQTWEVFTIVRINRRVIFNVGVYNDSICNYIHKL